MKIGDRVEMNDNSWLGTYWGTVIEIVGYDRYLISWDNFDGHNWIWSPSRLSVEQILEANGVIHAS